MKRTAFTAYGTDLLTLKSLLTKAKTFKQKVNILNGFKYYITEHGCNHGNKLALLANTNDMIFWSMVRTYVNDIDLEKAFLIQAKKSWDANFDHKLSSKEDAIQLATIREQKYMFDILTGGDDYSKRQYNEKQQQIYTQIFKNSFKEALSLNNMVDFSLDDALLQVEGIY